MLVECWHWDPFLGLDLFFWRLKDTNSSDYLATDRVLLEKYGKTVFTTTNWDMKQYVTMHPTVLQTVLALEVDKFGVALLNHPVCAPLLDEGIMIVNGNSVCLMIFFCFVIQVSVFTYSFYMRTNMIPR